MQWSWKAIFLINVRKQWCWLARWSQAAIVISEFPLYFDCMRHVHIYCQRGLDWKQHIRRGVYFVHQWVWMSRAWRVWQRVSSGQSSHDQMIIGVLIWSSNLPRLTFVRKCFINSPSARATSHTSHVSSVVFVWVLLLVSPTFVSALTIWLLDRDEVLIWQWTGSIHFRGKAWSKRCAQRRVCLLALDWFIQFSLVWNHFHVFGKIFLTVLYMIIFVFVFIYAVDVNHCCSPNQRSFCFL